ncbi:hypothetical protein [Pedobacter jamesrossensis]|uniref:Uncharacterized protein n=1 Tax=Pedobacter jamesrossensis TaxID=1908238 RepID=A0ABV8NJQ0_9SPHI
MLNPIAKTFGNSSTEIEAFVRKGNGTIFNDISKDLKSLYEHSPLKSTDAENWYGYLLLKEQKLIESYYQNLSETSLRKLQKSLRKESTFSKILPGLEFEGNLLNIPGRWHYGMKMMQYKNPDITLLN